MMAERLSDDKVVILWKKPLIEIIKDEVWIDDKLIWKHGEFVK